MTKEIAKEFYREFVSKLADLKHEFDSSDDLIRIPSLNKDFGDIEIHIWHREIIVLIGNNFHTHFDIDIFSDNTLNNNAKLAICEVIRFIQDIVNDKILLRVKMRGERVIYSSIVDEDDINKPIESMAELSSLLRSIFPKKSKVFLYFWSGAQIEIK